MRVILATLLALAACTAAHPVVSCASYTCANGWSTRTNVPPENIACLAGICTDRVCCNPPTCASLENPTCILKPNPRAIQCPGSTLAGCTNRVCCANNQNTEAPTFAPTAAPTAPRCVDHTIYFSNFLGDFRVNKMRVTFDAASGQVALVGGSIAIVSKTNGGDGIILNPQNDKQLFVGGQNDRLFIVDTTIAPNADFTNNWWRQKTTGLNIFHVFAPDNDHVIGSNVDGRLNVSYHTLSAGTLHDGDTAPIIPVLGSQQPIVTVFRAGDRLGYTTSSEDGEPGNVGFCTVSSAALVAEEPFITGVPAHAAVYHAATNSVLVFGGKRVGQYSLTGVLIAELDVTSLIGTGGTSGFRHLDNGVIFADRWLLIVANNGKLLWFDLQSTGSIATATAGSFVVTNGDAFDAITMPVCNLA